ncbi:MAG: STAS domain-containing protein [Planctomycetota bacterium]
MTTKIEAMPAQAGRGRQGPSIEVERGPDWLFVRFAAGPVAGQRELTSSVWETIREHGASRVVLELDHVGAVDEALGGAIGELGTRVRDAGGLIRICGLSEPKLSRLRSMAVAAGVPHFDTRSDAVGGRGKGS